MNCVLAAAVITACAPCLADPAIHYAPAENLEHIDVALIDRAECEIAKPPAFSVYGPFDCLPIDPP